MAIGARITSDNLSGKTATVTFIPITGTTSGSTQNLGELTIPFNHITSHPYGYYNITVTEYDYTYTILVPEPELTSQMFVISDLMVNDNNYGAATLNFTDFTATILDLNVDNQWNNDDLYPLTKSGFGYFFSDSNNWQNRLVIFTDVTNTEIGRYSGNTNGCYSYDDLDGRWITFNDCGNGILTYSNGVNVYTYTYDSARYNLDIQWDYDSTMSDNSFIVVKYDNLDGTDNHAILFKNDGTQITLNSWDSADGFDYNYQMAFNQDFYVVEQYDIDNSAYTQFEIFDVDANLLESVSLTGNTYNGRYYGFIASDKFYNVYYSNDVGVDYLIHHYNHTTSVLQYTFSVRTSNYQNVWTNSNNDFWPNDTNTNGLSLAFYDTWGNWTNWGVEVNYLRYVYLLEGQTSFSDYSFADNQLKSAIPWYQLSKNATIPVNNGDGFASILTIMSGGTHIENLGVNVSDIYNSNWWYLYDRSVYEIITSPEYTGLTLTLLGENGLTQDQITTQFTSAYGENSRNSETKSFYYGCNTTSSGYTGFYVNDLVTNFTPTEYFHITEGPWWWYSPTFTAPTNIVLYNTIDNTCRVLSENSISSQFTLTSYLNDRGIRVGKDKFIHYYNDGDGYYHFKLYDFSGNLLNSLDTTSTSYNFIDVGEDAYVVAIYDVVNNVYDYYMLGETSIPSVSLGDYDRDTMLNDYIWWD